VEYCVFHVFASRSKNERGKNGNNHNLLFEISLTAFAAATLIGVDATVCALAVAMHPHNLSRLATVEAPLQV